MDEVVPVFLDFVDGPKELAECRHVGGGVRPEAVTLDQCTSPPGFNDNEYNSLLSVPPFSDSVGLMAALIPPNIKASPDPPETNVSVCPEREEGRSPVTLGRAQLGRRLFFDLGGIWRGGGGGEVVLLRAIQIIIRSIGANILKTNSYMYR